MACEVKILTTIYNPETNKVETMPITIGTVDESEQITMDRVVELFSTLSPSERQNLSNTIVKAKQQNITDKMIKDHQFIGNTTVGELLERYPALAETYKINPNLYEQYTIIRGSSFKLNNVNYNGRVLTADGKEIFIIKDSFGATSFIKYLQAKEKAETIFNGETPIPTELQPYMEELGIIVDKYNLPIQNLIIEALNNKNTFQPFVHKNTTITPRQVLGKVIAILNNEYDYDDNLTDLEVSLSGIKEKTKGYDWSFNKNNLYDTLVTYFPDLGQQLSKEAFRNLSADELNALLTGPNGLFLGHPKLSRATVKEVTTGNKTIVAPAELTSTKIGKITHDQIKEGWEIIKQEAQKVGLELPDKYSTYAKESPHAMMELFNMVKLQYTDTVDGKVHLAKARVVSTPKGKSRVEFYYEYEIQNEPKVKESPSFITLTFPYSSIGDIYNFGYNTQSIFSPVNEGNIEGGKYKGMFVYKASIQTSQGIKPVYAISRNIISPNSFMSTYPTLEAALYGIEQQNASDKIYENSLLTIKQSIGTPRQSKIELKNIQEGQILTTLDLELPRVQIQQLPGSLKTLMNLTVPEFQEQFIEIPNISKIDTPEKAAAFLLLVGNQLSHQDYLTISKSKQASSLIDIIKSFFYEEIVADVIQKIDKAPLKNYYVEKLTISKNTSYKEKRKVATLKLLESNGNSVNVSGTKVGDVGINEFIGQTMNEAINFFNTQYGLDIVSMTSEEMLQFSQENNLELEHSIQGTKAFIYDGRIYINTSNAKTSDLFHEVSHIFLGLLKAQYPEGYQQIIETYKSKSSFARKFGWVSSSYSTFAMQDQLEEAVVDMIADEMFYDNQLSVGFNSERFTEMIQDIMSRVDSFKKDLMDNGLGFNGFVKTLMDANESKLRQQRIVTNFIKSKLGTEITENCK